MVYHGPSRGCGRCRQQRVKCDQNKPACDRCSRRGIQCPGYRSEVDLIFRNDTRKERTKATKSPEARVSEPVVHFVRGQDSDRDGSAESESIPDTLLLPIRDQATCHLLSNFVLVPYGSNRNTQGFMHYLVMLKKSPDVPLHFQYAFDACALASFNNQVSRDTITRKKALNKYIRALSELSTTLRNPTAAQQEATLASTLLCCMFETLTGVDPDMKSVAYHTEGAIQLAKDMGRERLLRSELGQAIFAAVRHQMMSNCMRIAKGPDMSNDWWIFEKSTETQHDEYLRIMIDSINIRVEVERVFAAGEQTSSKLKALIDTCQANIAACRKWEKTVPNDWRYYTDYWQDRDNFQTADYLLKAKIFPGRVDVYPDIGIVSVWNSVRVCRLLLNSLALRCEAQLCAPKNYRTTPAYMAIARDCAKVVEDIIASVPCYLGYVPKQQQASPLYSHHSFGFACGEENALKGLGGLRLLWMLPFLHALDFVTDDQRLWVRGRLQYIGRRMGVQHADNMSKMRGRLPSMTIARDAELRNQDYSSDSDGTPPRGQLSHQAFAETSGPFLPHVLWQR
ncbi:hypothetical protein HIM_03829 [Hirsutella minnesotensis 3608]|uniref:Zn(2)-C6 fungal-type domain-containing protein n=1 Tax=Hirsutella minnesotensis 3608 TaxID=1043627 RepID=A0A0F8A2D3_9HYPO|nr:hypothetical protein HIM_03829 [Hirsutella minnesotensis 3608]